MALILQELTPIIKEVFPNCDTKRALLMALVHDDAEMITGDVQLGHKLLMSAKELENVHDAEAAAIEVLAKEFPEFIAGYSYRELLLEVLRRDSLEADLLTYADKLDAYCESLHEVLAGNITALRSLMTYVWILTSFPQLHPNVQPLFSRTSPLLDIGMRADPTHVRRDRYAHLQTPHTAESVRKDTDFMTYNHWRTLVMEHMEREGLEMLTRQKEFFH